jgi:hypothetical protein
MSAPQTSGSSSEVVILIFAFIIFNALRRTYRMYRGTRFSKSRTILYAAVYVLIGVVFSATSFYEGVPALLAPLYAVVAAVAAAGSYMYSDRRITFWKSDGTVYFRGGVVIYLIYLAGLIIRLTIDFVVIGPDVFNFTPGLTLTGTALYATIATDLLLMLGVGLLLGRNLRVLKRYGRIERGEDAIPDTPPPLGSESGSAPQPPSISLVTSGAGSGSSDHQV